MDDLVPDLPEHVAGLLAGTMDLHEFQHWFIMNQTSIEVRGTDDEVDFANRVENIMAEFTGGYISADQFIDAVREEYGLYVSQRELAAELP